MRYLCSAALAATLVLAAAPAAATHNEKYPQITSDTAYTVPGGNHKIGLLAIEYGIVDELQFTTWPILWTLAIANLSLEYKFLEVGPVAVSLGVAALHVNTRAYRAFVPDIPDADLAVIPVELISSFRLHKEVTLSAGAQLTSVEVQGSFNEDDFQGAAAVTNLQTHLSLEWRVSSLVALILHGRYLVFQTTQASTDVNVDVDEFTNIRAQGVVSSDVLDFPHSFQVVGAIQFSGEITNVRVGAGYGNFVVPAVNFVLPARSLVPQFDIYWRF